MAFMPLPKVAVFPALAFPGRRIRDKDSVDDLLILSQKFRIFRVWPFGLRDDAVNDLLILRDISQCAGDRFFLYHPVGDRIDRSHCFDKLLFPDHDGREALVFTVFVDGADHDVQVQFGAAQVIEDQYDPFLYPFFVIIFNDGFQGDVFHRIDGNDRGGNASADRVERHQNVFDHCEQAAVFDALAFLIQLAQKWRTGIEPLLFDCVIQSGYAVHAEQRDTNNEVRGFESLRQLFFYEMCFPAAPLAGEQKGAQMLLFAAIADQFL